MAHTVKAIPDGQRTITPHLVVKGGAEAMAFYEKAYGAIECRRMAAPDGKLMHGDLQIGDSHVYLCEESPEWGQLSPLSLGGSPVSINIYTEDAEAFFARAIAAGATVKMPLMDMFWGDRFGKLADPFGHEWTVSQHLADYTPEEMAERGAAAMADAESGSCA